jgi:hypothetical protein
MRQNYCQYLSELEFVGVGSFSALQVALNEKCQQYEVSWHSSFEYAVQIQSETARRLSNDCSRVLGEQRLDFKKIDFGSTVQNDYPIECGDHSIQNA